jgi:hypothetical protein
VGAGKVHCQPTVDNDIDIGDVGQGNARHLDTLVRAEHELLVGTVVDTHDDAVEQARSAAGNIGVAEVDRVEAGRVDGDRHGTALSIEGD